MKRLLILKSSALSVNKATFAKVVPSPDIYIRRKVRATQSVLLPNGKGTSWMCTESATENKLPELLAIWEKVKT